MEFVPAENGSYRYATLNPKYFNPFDCKGELQKISKQPADGLGNQISRTLEELRKGKSEKKVDEHQTKAPGKQKLSPLYSAVP